MQSDPFEFFGAWFEAAKAAEPVDPDAMTLATVSAAGRPSARMVLLKAWDTRGFVFYSNAGSRKAEEMRGQAQVALLFYWKSSNRQIRIEGQVSPVEPAQADAYFATRPRASQIGAWASEQSRVLPSREVFEARIAEAERRFEGGDVKRPDFWPGWRVVPDYFEFWQGVRYRLHDRQVFRREGEGWARSVLYP